MKTKLEMMVTYLAGRKGEAAESIRRELDDPTSEASRCLVALQSRSRSAFSAEPPETPVPMPSRSIPNGATAREMPGKRLPSLLLGAFSAALVLVAVGMAWQAQDERLRHLEATLARREAAWGDRFDLFEAALTRCEALSKRQIASSNGPNPQEPKPPVQTDGTTSLALARIEARLGELGQRLGEAQPRQDQDDQQLAQVRRDLDRLRQEVESAVRTSKQESQGLSVTVREILELLRRLMMHSRMTDPMQVPMPIPGLPQGREPGLGQWPGKIPGPGQVPGQAQMPDQDHSNGTPGRGRR
jgi:hypothetical protein